MGKGARAARKSAFDDHVASIRDTKAPEWASTVKLPTSRWTVLKPDEVKVITEDDERTLPVRKDQAIASGSKDPLSFALSREGDDGAESGHRFPRRSADRSRQESGSQQGGRLCARGVFRDRAIARRRTSQAGVGGGARGLRGEERPGRESDRRRQRPPAGASARRSSSRTSSSSS